MTQYNTLNVKLSNSKFDKLTLGIKNGTEVTLKISPNVAGDSNNENNFLHKLLLTNTQLPKLRKAFTNGSSVYIKLSKTQMHKTGQPERFLDWLIKPLLKTGLPLIGNLLNRLPKSIQYH